MSILPVSTRHSFQHTPDLIEPGHRPEAAAPFCCHLCYRALLTGPHELQGQTAELICDKSHDYGGSGAQGDGGFSNRQHSSAGSDQTGDSAYCCL